MKGIMATRNKVEDYRDTAYTVTLSDKKEFPEEAAIDTQEASSWVKSITYNPETRRLLLGTEYNFYVYSDVSPLTFARMMFASSPGEAVNTELEYNKSYRVIFTD